MLPRPERTSHISGSTARVTRKVSAWGKRDCTFEEKQDAEKHGNRYIAWFTDRIGLDWGWVEFGRLRSAGTFLPLSGSLRFYQLFRLLGSLAAPTFASRL